MPDALLTYLRQSLPAEIATLAEPYIGKLEQGQYDSILEDLDAQIVFGNHEDSGSDTAVLDDFPCWNDYIFHRLGTLLADRRHPEKQTVYFCIGYAALLAFLQSNVTGPPLPFSPASKLLSSRIASDQAAIKALQKSMLGSLGIDGIAAYNLTPNVELLCLADAIFTCPPILKNIKAARWAKLRLEFVHQRLLSEISPTLQGVIYDDLRLIQDDLFYDEATAVGVEMQVEFLLERATIHIHHGFDKIAREDLDVAKRTNRFEFALTGLLGKRTKFQQHDISQLIVLAKSNADGESASNGKAAATTTNGETHVKPENLDLNDDTLLESISFAQTSQELAQLVDQDSLSPSLASLNPADQPPA